MEADSLSDRLPLLSTANPDTISWLESVSECINYPPQTPLVELDDWGKEVFVILSGWVALSTKIQQQEKTLAVLGTGDYFGVMAIFGDCSPLHRAIALSETELLIIPTQRFLQLLLKDNRLQQRILELTTKRLRHVYTRLQSTPHSVSYQVIKLLIYLAERYGKTTEKGVEILQLSEQILADLVNSNAEEIREVLEKLIQTNLLVIRAEKQRFYLPNLKQLHHLSKQT
ncbi:MAG: Crp/Fnr family transcriptional regulator [Microcystaceae cyanobacterium]